MPYEMIEKIKIEDVTTESLDGTGTFDVLMRAVNGHINKEYTKNRIVGTEYSTVYLGALNSVLDKAMGFAMEVDKSWLEAELLRLQAINLEIEADKLAAEVILINAQVEKMGKEMELLDAQILIAACEKLKIEAQTDEIEQNTANAVIEGTVLVATECKLRAEFDVLMEQKLKTIAETSLLGQKMETEKAQTNGAAVTPDSVIGKQVSLYDAQANGFLRDAEQKAADIMTKTWSVRRTTDEGTGVEGNGLNDGNIARSVNKLLGGVDA
jgi:hypothetical protein